MHRFFYCRLIDLGTRQRATSADNAIDKAVGSGSWLEGVGVHSTARNSTTESMCHAHTCLRVRAGAPNLMEHPLFVFLVGVILIYSYSAAAACSSK